MITNLFRGGDGKLYLSFEKEISSDGKVLNALRESLNKENLQFASMSLQGRLNRVSFEITENKH